MYSTVEDWRHLFSLSFTSSCLSVFLLEWNSGLVKSHSVSTPHESTKECQGQMLVWETLFPFIWFLVFSATISLYRCPLFSFSLSASSLFGSFPVTYPHSVLLPLSSSPCVLSIHLVLRYSIHPSSKAPYGIFSHILDDIWILYIVNTISRVSQSIQAFYQFACLNELHFTLEFSDILLQSADRQIHSCTVFRLCLIH